jgi:hypothetical protein
MPRIRSWVTLALEVRLRPLKRTPHPHTSIRYSFRRRRRTRNDAGIVIYSIWTFAFSLVRPSPIFDACLFPLLQRR